MQQKKHVACMGAASLCKTQRFLLVPVLLDWVALIRMRVLPGSVAVVKSWRGDPFLAHLLFQTFHVFLSLIHI